MSSHARYLSVVFLMTACTLSENPRVNSARGSYERRSATAVLLAPRGDLAVGWDEQRSLDLGDGVDWAATVDGRSLGGALIRMFSVDERLPVEYPVIPKKLSILAPSISADNTFVSYQTTPADPTRKRGNELWIGHLTQQHSRGRTAPKASAVQPFQLEREEGYRFFCWSPGGRMFAYYRSESRQLVIGESFLDKSEQVKVRILQQVSPGRDFSDCLQIAWLSDSNRILSLWKLLDGSVSVWSTKAKGAGKLIKSPVPYPAKVLRNGQPTFVRLIPCPYEAAETKDLVLVEAQQPGSKDEDQRRIDVWDLATGKLKALPGLSGNYLAPRWCGHRGFAASQVIAGIARSRGTRWQSWRLSVFSEFQAQGQSNSRPLVLPYDFAALDWNQNSTDMDEQLIWLVDGELCVFIDPDTRRNIRISDHRGKNRLNLLKNRDRQTPRILWLQVVNARGEDGLDQNFLYFLEDLRGANLKRIEITPLSNR
jgi:hypothetical protein